MSLPAGAPYIPPTLLRTKRTQDKITITKDAGYRHSLKEVYCYNLAKASYIDVRIGSKDMLRLYQPLTTEPLVSAPTSKIGDRGVLQFIREICGVNDLFYAEEDEDLVVDCSNASLYPIILYYKEISKGEKQTLFGSQARKLLVVAPITNAVAVTSTSTIELNTSKQITGLLGLKNGFTIPSNYRFTLYGLIMDNGLSTGSFAQKLHIIDESSELITPETREGINVSNNENMAIGNVNNGAYFKFPQPYTFGSGHTITIKVDCYHDGSNDIAIDSIVLQLIGIAEYVG